MKMVKINAGGRCAEGVVQGETVYVVGPWHAADAAVIPFTLPLLPPAELAALAEGAAERFALDEVTLAMPIDPGAKIFCAGINYRNHADEISADAPAHPVIFLRTHDSLVAHGQPIVRPRVSQSFDYEGEIAVMIGRGGRHIAAADAMGHVVGYTCFMDGSVRDYQRHALPAGKNFWRTGALGPWVVSADEIGSADIGLRTEIEGETMQSTTASQMIFGIAELIEYCSRITPLSPGDILATGTPGGVGSRREPPRWLRPGETVHVDVDRIGRLSNPVIDEEPA